MSFHFIAQRLGQISALTGIMLVSTAASAAAPTAVAATLSAAYPGEELCLTGFVWREAGPGDMVCVTPDSRSRAQMENATAMSRINPYGPYGPQTCTAGYVWREAFAGDRVCVTPDIRSMVASENALAMSRRAGMSDSGGPYMGSGDPSLTCRTGYVWREAGPGDYVCVTPESRDRARSDNAKAALRVNPFGGGYGGATCFPGYVWREAFPGDQVCVKPKIREQSARENAEASMHRVGSAGYPTGPYYPGGAGMPPVATVVDGPRCRIGFVWREAGPGDFVCVDPGSRARAAQENSLAASRYNPYGPYGPQTCVAGFVWREAFAGDRVCVTPGVRDLVRSENMMAASRREGVMATPVYIPPPGPVIATPVYVPPPVIATPVYVPPPGPVMATPVISPPLAPLGIVVGRCRTGFVWREARPSDRVCVTPASRSRAAQENSLASSRVNPTGAYGPQTCIAGFVWREAFANDRVCVTPSVRSLVQNENAMAESRRAP